MKVLILAGGSGTRLWPMSQDHFPKQFLRIFGQDTLLQQSIERALLLASLEDIFLLTTEPYREEVVRQVMERYPRLASNILVEPVSRNTAPAIALAMQYVQRRDSGAVDELFLVMPSDHLIAPQERFIEYVEEAKLLASSGYVVTFGVHPNKPETGYGYIHTGASLQTSGLEVKQFIEKPDYATAQQYLIDGHYLWNAGIFLFSFCTMSALFHSYAPDIARYMEGSFEEMLISFSRMPNISMDYAILEKAPKVATIPLELSWSDVGSWDSVYDALDKDTDSNITLGRVMTIDTKNSLIIGNKKLVSTIGIQDMMVIETDDAVLVVGKGHSQKVKDLVMRLKGDAVIDLQQIAGC